jgi:hypothetical protein
MRQPLKKGDLGENEGYSSVCVCIHPPEQHQPNNLKQSGGGDFHVFSISSPVCVQIKLCKDWQNPQSMLIPNLFRFFQISLLKDPKMVITIFRPVSVCMKH